MVLSEEEVLKRLYSKEEIVEIKKEGVHLANVGRWEARYEQKAREELEKMSAKKEVEDNTDLRPARTVTC